MASFSFEDNDDMDVSGSNDVESGGVIILPDSDVESEEEEEKGETKKDKDKDKKDKKKKKKRPSPPPPTPLPVKRHKIRVRNEFRIDESLTLEIREFENMNCEGAVLIEGFPSKGLSSVMAANFLIKSLKLPLVGEVFSRAFPTVGRVASWQPSNPIRIYGNQKVVIFVSEVSFEEPQLCWTMAEAIYDFGNRHDCPLLITLESVRKSFEIDLPEDGLTQERVFELLSARMEGRTQEEKEEAAKTVFKRTKSPKKAKKVSPKEQEVTKTTEPSEPTEPQSSPPSASPPPSSSSSSKKDKTSDEEKTVESDKDEILFFTNDSEYAVKARAAGGVPTKNLIVGGVTGCLTAESHTRELPVICVISHHSALDSDDKAAMNCLTFIGKIVDSLEIDVEPLKKKAASYEKQVKKALTEMAHSAKRRSTISQSMYM